LRDPSFELNRFIIRGVYLAVVAILLAYLTAFDQRLRTEMSGLADWPRELPQELEALVRAELSHMAHIFGAPRVFMAWEEPEEPWLYLATHFNGEFRVIRESPTAFQPLVPEPLADAHFLCLDARAPPCTVIYKLSAGIERWHGAPVHPGLQERFSIRSVLSLNLQGESVSGRVFVLDRPWMTIDALTLGEIVARLVQSDIDRFCLQRRLQQAAAAEERVRLARNLHDGLLQSLTAVALQLEAAHRLLEQGPQATRERLEDIQTLILAEQRDLRSLVQQMKPVPVGSGGESASLEMHLEELARRVARQWSLRVELTLEPRAAPLPDGLAHEIYRIVQEALVNAARHTDASVVRVQFGIEDDEVRITVADDGHGFPFRGRYDLAALTAMSMGPVSLKQRIAYLRGQLSIDSSESGSRLEITLPLG
jgi:signal transduction histidine kinase